LRLTDPSQWLRTYRDPVAVSGLIIDLIPIYAVLALGWGAGALVMLYWLENLIVGLATVVRMGMTGVRQGGASLAGMVFMAAFFAVHYGLFCFVHGTFLVGFLAPDPTSSAFPGFGGLIDQALTAGPGIGIIAAMLLAWHLLSTIAETASEAPQPLHTLMMAPYGRVVILHIGILLGAGALVAMGEPMLGVLALILLDVAWGVVLTLRRQSKPLGVQS